MDEKKMKMLALTSAILADKQPTMAKEYFQDYVMPKKIEPEVVIAPSGQERRRERRKQARKK